MGFAFTSDMDKINQTALQALENTKLNNPDENYAFSQKEKVNDIDKLYDKKFENLDLDESIDFLNNIITKANETQCDVTSAGFSASRGESLILNSNGVSIANKSTGFGAGLSVNIEAKENVATAYDSISSRFYDLDGDKLAEDVCKLAMDSVD
jgi:PmbA protein